MGYDDPVAALNDAKLDAPVCARILTTNAEAFLGIA